MRSNLQRSQSARGWKSGISRLITVWRDTCQFCSGASRRLSALQCCRHRDALSFRRQTLWPDDQSWSMVREALPIWQWRAPSGTNWRAMSDESDKWSLSLASNFVNFYLLFVISFNQFQYMYLNKNFWIYPGVFKMNGTYCFHLYKYVYFLIIKT